MFNAIEAIDDVLQRSDFELVRGYYFGEARRSKVLERAVGPMRHRISTSSAGRGRPMTAVAVFATVTSDDLAVWRAARIGSVPDQGILVGVQVTPEFPSSTNPLHRWDLADSRFPDEFAGCFQDRVEPYFALFSDLGRLAGEFVEGRLPPSVRISEAIELLLATEGPSVATTAAENWFAGHAEGRNKLNWHLAHLRSDGIPRWGFLDPEEGVARLIVEGALPWSAS